MRHVECCQQQREMEHLCAGSSVLYSRSRKNRHRNLRRVWGTIRSTELCTDLSIAEREHNLEALRCELQSFQRGKQFKSSAVHHPDQFTDEPILDAKTYERFESRIKQIVRDLSARAEGAREKRDELHREVAELRGVLLTKRSRTKLNREMCLAPRRPGGELFKFFMIVVFESYISVDRSTNTPAQVLQQEEENQSCEEIDCQTEVVSGFYYQRKNRVFGWRSYTLFEARLFKD